MDDPEIDLRLVHPGRNLELLHLWGFSGQLTQRQEGIGIENDCFGFQDGVPLNETPGPATDGRVKMISQEEGEATERRRRNGMSIN